LRRPRKGRTELDLPAGSHAQLEAVAERDRRVDALRRKVDGLLARVESGDGDALTEIDRKEDEVRALRERTPDLPRGYLFSQVPPETLELRLRARGQASRPGAVVAPGVPAVLVPSQPEFPGRGGSTSRRRLTLARWLARPDHPLTARVIVNRVWQFH